MKRTVQTTLFGNLVTKEKYVKQQSNVFERFMNKYFQINERKKKTRKSLTEDGLDEWRKIKDSPTELVNFFKFEAKTEATSVNAWNTSTSENTLASTYHRQCNL